MKKLLTFSSLTIIATAAIAELARDAGIPVSPVLSLGNAFLALTLTTLALVLIGDYGRKVRPIAIRVTRPTVVLPPRRSIANAYHHVYAIRRGAEAARLASPNHMVHFPRRKVRLQQAA